MSGRIAGMVLWLLAAVATSARAQTVEYLHTDALGSVVAVTDANRNVLERREYEPYGSQLTPAVANGPGYAGHVQDAATGLVYMQQRYYDAQIGRFLSVDPVTANVGTGANFNRYWYVNNSPYRYVDPTGRVPLAIPLAIEACVASFACTATAAAGAVVVGNAIEQSGDEIAEALGAVTDAVADAHQSLVTSIVDEIEQVEKALEARSHKKGARPSTQEKHEKGQARKRQDRGGEKGDDRRDPPRKRPPDHKGPWPPPEPSSSGTGSADNPSGERVDTQEQPKQCFTDADGKIQC
jgi:RHS repeat-associated protein